MIEPYYKTDLGRLYHADCLSILPQLKEGVDLVLTDPPYGVNKAEWDTNFPGKDTWEALSRTMKSGATLLIFPGEANLPRKMNILFRNFTYQWVIPWYKPNAMQFGKTGFSKHSLIWWLSAGAIAFARPKMIDVIEAPMGENCDKHGHPSPKSLRVINRLVLNFSNETHLVLDPFLGSGTTALACERLGRRWIGIEISEAYCKIAVERIEQERSQLKLGLG